jgi:uncharacterized protein
VNRIFFSLAKMKYQLSSLVTASLGTRTTINVQERAVTLDEDLEVEFLQGEIQFTRVNNGIYAQGRLQTQVDLTCVRCLEPFSHPLDVEIAERYLFSPRDVVEESDYLIAPDGTVDLTEPTREQIWVSLPIQPLCRSDCQGLCAQCGINLNYESCTCQEETIDPRLAALKELL